MTTKMMARDILIDLAFCWVTNKEVMSEELKDKIAGLRVDQALTALAEILPSEEEIISTLHTSVNENDIFSSAQAIHSLILERLGVRR